jgi:hypothetical protein
MRGGWTLGVLTVLATAVAADAAVMCIKVKKGAPKEGAPIKLRTTCRANEQPVDAVALGLQGPAGAPGEAGAPGAQGLQGSPGAPGLSEVQVVTAQGTVVISSPGTSTATASCAAGQKVLGGGAALVQIVPGTVNDQRIDESRPVTGDPQGWTVSMTASVTEDWRVDAHAVCATVAEE